MSDFSSRELELEREMTERGSERYRSGIDRARRIGRESLTRTGNHLIREALGRLISALNQWLKEQRELAPVNRSSAFPVVTAMPPRLMSFVAFRAIFDHVSSGGCTYNGLVHAVGRSMEQEFMARWVAKEHRGSFDTARRRAHVVNQRARSRLRRSIKELAKEKGYPKWGIAPRIRGAAVMVALAERSTGVIEIRMEQLARRKRAALVILSEETAKWITESNLRSEFLEPFYMPMLDPPQPWAKGEEGGYATDLVRRKSLVKSRSRAVRALVAEAEMPAVYSAVNALQATAWEVNPEVLMVASHLWDLGVPCPGLGQAENDAYPAMPAEGKTREWMRKRFLVRRGNLYRASRRVEASRVLWLGKRMQPEGAFFFPQQIDFRGRVYPVPPFLQPQGPDLARGLLRFQDGCLVELDQHGVTEARTATRSAFFVHGANCFGVDKVSLMERRAWVLEHMEQILAVHADPLDCLWWQEAAEPWQFLAWALEAGQLFDEGRVYSRVPCHADGSNNGLQILSLLLRDPIGGASTNCVPGPAPRDIYRDVADEVTRLLRERDDATARAWLAWFPGGQMPRDATKRSVMTLPYGATAWSSRQYVLDWFEEEIRLGRSSPWGADPYFPHVTVLADLVWAAIGVRLGPAMAAMDWMKACAREVVGAGIAPRWVAPSGFPVRQGYTNYQVQRIRTKFGEQVRWVHLRKKGERLSLRRQLNAIAPNFVHSLDAAVLVRVLARAKAAGINSLSTIHDSFGTHATHCAQLGRILREEYAEVFSKDLLDDFRNQLATLMSGVGLPQLPVRGDLDPRGVIGSTYFFS